MTSYLTKNIAGFFSAAMFFVVDKIFKHLVSNEHYSQVLIENLITLDFFKNHFIAFSIPIYSWVTKIISGFILIVIFLLLLKIIYHKNVYFLPLSFIFWGALSNFIDRIQYNYVIDYIQISGLSVFNLADVSISLGLIIIIYFYFFKKIDFI